MKVTLAQLNPVVGDVAGNLRKISDTLARLDSPTDLVIFPELVLVAYPPRDLLEKPALIEQVEAAVQELLTLSRQYPEVGLLVGAPLPTGEAAGKGLQLYDIHDLDTVKKIAAELSPKGLLYCVDVASRDEALRIMDWLEAAT